MAHGDIKSPAAALFHAQVVAEARLLLIKRRDYLFYRLALASFTLRFLCKWMNKFAVNRLLVSTYQVIIVVVESPVDLLLKLKAALLKLLLAIFTP